MPPRGPSKGTKHVTMRDPETGYNKAVIINSAFGLGELVVSGGVKPDEFIVDKRVLKDINCDFYGFKNKEPIWGNNFYQALLHKHLF